MWLYDTTALGKNPKLTSKWLGLYNIVDLDENKAKIEIKPNKLKIINISRLKAFCEDKTQDTDTNVPQRPMSKALKKAH